MVCQEAEYLIEVGIGGNGGAIAAWLREPAVWRRSWQKSMEIVAGEGPVEGGCRVLVMGLKGKQALFEFLQR
jgi:hypothetical protein